MTPGEKAGVGIAVVVVAAAAVFGTLALTGDDEPGVITSPEPAPTATGTAVQSIENDLFAMELPDGWRQEGDEGTNPRQITFADGAGRRVTVIAFPKQNPAHSGFSSDSVWSLSFNSARDGFEVGQQEKCIGGAAESAEGCSAGDGRFDGYALLKGPEGDARYIGDYEYQFAFGDSRSEEDADTEVFEKIIESFRAKAS